MGSGKRRREVSSLLFLIIPFFTGIANRSPFGEERGILLIAASTGIMRLVRAVARKKLQPRRTHGLLYEISRMKSSNIIKKKKKIKIDSI